MISLFSILRRWRHQFQVQFLELLNIHFGRGVHHQVLRIAVHREQNHVTDGVCACEEHDDAINTWRDAAMGRGAEFEGVNHARASPFCPQALAA